MRVLSLFDGMACGMLAMKAADQMVNEYVAYEIDKYATQTAQHNFPIIQEKGDVFQADFTQYEGFDFLVGGSPCTYWSIAQTKHRETVASGMGWELFSQYARALKKSKPKYFIYENNKSMSKDIRASITDTFGFEPICINSALVSAQNRQRLYWCGIRQEDGTYRKANIKQPEDRGILLPEILETNAVPYQSKADVLTASYNGACIWNSLERHQRSMVAEPICTTDEGKAKTLIAGYGSKQGTLNIIGASGFGSTGVAVPLNPTKDGKSGTLTATYYKASEVPIHEYGSENGRPKVAICIAQRGRNPENPTSREAGLPTEQRFEAREDLKTNTLTTVAKDNLVGEPIRVGAMPSPDGTVKGGQALRIYSAEAKSVTLKGCGGGAGGKTGLYAEPVCMRYTRTEEAKECRKAYENHEIHHGYHELHELNPREDGKTNTLSTVLKDNPICEPVYAVTSCPSDKRERNHQRYLEQNMPECFRVKEATKQGYTDIKPGDCVDMSMPNSKTRRGRNMETKSNCLQTSCEFYQYCGCVSQPIYEVKDGMITVKGKQYPIKLVDGLYIIRKLTVREAMRLQTVPEWYEFPVSNAQAYKMLGNGWTVEVIAHLIRSILRDNGKKELPEGQLSIWDLV